MLELEVYCAVVVILLLVDGKQAAAAHAVAAAAVRRVVEAGRRSCDVLAAKLYYYYSWTAELTGALETIRAPLLDLLRTATLRHDSLGQEVRISLRPLLQNHRFSPNPSLALVFPRALPAQGGFRHSLAANRNMTPVGFPATPRLTQRAVVGLCDGCRCC